MLSRTNIVLALLLAAVVGMTGLLDIDYSRPNWEFMPDMKYTPAWHAYSANPNFANRRTMQAPVPGTIARGELPLAIAAPEKEGDLPEVIRPKPKELALAKDDSKKREDEAQRKLQASVERGGDVYRVFCNCCHGASGAGDGPVSTRGLASPSLLTEKSREKAMKDGQLFYVLTYGRDTDWPGSMLPFAGQLSREQRWDVINYVRELQSAAPVVPAEEPIETPNDEPAAQSIEQPTDEPAAQPKNSTPNKNTNPLRANRNIQPPPRG